MICGPAAGAMDCTTKIHRKRRKRGTHNHFQAVCLFDIVRPKTKTTTTIESTAPPSPTTYSKQITVKSATSAKKSCGHDNIVHVFY